LPKGPEYDQLVQRVMSNEIIRGKRLSEDYQLTLIVARALTRMSSRAVVLRDVNRRD